MSKLFVLLVVALVATVAMAQVLKDAAGYTYDIQTGQVSSPVTGKVYNTAPHYYGYGYGYPYGLHHYAGYPYNRVFY
ncbi:cuticle protein 7-like [Tachypleus tridentatus]|uniref:cuticle protein 7-like n=1 Tax=Tachypleus tridentatus TaxID=6853 RepID=UPI003FD3748C